jgi:tetratricopeptide (TPR) repeat protein
LRGADRADVAIPLLKRMLEINPNSALAHGELGSIYSGLGNRKEAVEHLQAVARCEPTDPYGLIRLAEMTRREGRADEAAALCAKANEVDPASQLNRNLWGLVLLDQRRWADAEKQFRRVLLGDPTHWESNRGLSEALRQQGQAAEAVRFARRADHWSEGQNPEVLVTLGDAYAAAGRSTDARSAFDRALSAAGRVRPDLAATIRERLRNLK